METNSNETPAPSVPKVLIVIEGGIINGVYSDVPVSFAVKEYDDDMDEDVNAVDAQGYDCYFSGFNDSDPLEDSFIPTPIEKEPQS